MLSTTKAFNFIEAQMTNQNQDGKDNVIDIPLSEVMKKNYLDYSVSVIIDRALPDVRDGLKPVHRRGLYSMYALGCLPQFAPKKSARIVGDTMGKLHPHGDSSIYEALLNMARTWLRIVPLIDGQGNLGSIDGDNAAAMRYTEMKLSRAGAAFFEDIDKNTVRFIPNYDGSEMEPEILPVSYPNVLVNGATGIAVGMATNILPHNLNEVVDATLALQKNPELTFDELMQIMPAPDFPTGGVVYGLDGYRQAMMTGRGRVRLRAKWHYEEYEGEDLVIIDEIPYQVNKKELEEDIKEKCSQKHEDFLDITGIHDESNKEGIRLVISIKKSAVPAVVFNKLVKNTKLDTSFSYNIMLLEGLKPYQMNFLDILSKFLTFRTEVVTKRVENELNELKKRLHILEGLIIVLNRLDEALKIIRENKLVKNAQEELISAFGLSEIQSKAVLEMKLQKLTGSEVLSLKKEHKEYDDMVTDLLDTLAKPERIQQLVRLDLLHAKARFGVPRKTEVSYEDNEINMKDLIKKEPCLIHVTHGGYVKRTSLSYVETQNRKGKGRKGISVSEGDELASIYTGSTHDMFIVFTKSGKAFCSNVWSLPEGEMAGRGRHLKNIFESLDEQIASVLLIPEIEDGSSIVTVTENGKVKRTALSLYRGSLRKKGIQGVGIEEGDVLTSVLLVKPNDHLMMVSSSGKASRFEINDDALRDKGRKSVGVRGINLNKGDKVVSAVVIPANPDAALPQQYLLVVGEKGVGKRTKVEDFTVHNRGTKGITCFNINEKTGPIMMGRLVTDEDDVILTTASKTIRISVSDIKVSGRITSGVILMDVGNEKVVDVIKVPKEDVLEEVELDENSEIDVEASEKD